jgi:hypothetical protein
MDVEARDIVHHWLPWAPSPREVPGCRDRLQVDRVTGRAGTRRRNTGRPQLNSRKV